MKILVFPHAMELGGSQLNAIEIAAAVRDLGHEVGIVSEAGPLVERVHALGLRHHPLVERTGIRPSWRVVTQLRSIVRDQGYKVVHGYEWPPAMEAALGPGRHDAHVVCTIMSMSVAPFLPKSMPLAVGTRQIARDAVSIGFRDVSVIEPPVDVVQNAPGAVAPLSRADWNICSDALLMVSVSRLVPELKLEGLLSACDAIARLNQTGTHIHLMVVGDGPSRPDVTTAAHAANAVAGHEVVHLVGALDEPRPAYAAGDILIGMGGSAVRCLAFAKPLIVQGERGFWQGVTPDTLGTFLEGGWYGLGEPGEGRAEGAVRLVSEVQRMADERRRLDLGTWGRDLAVRRFSLPGAGKLQEEIYRRAIDESRFVPRAELVESASRAMFRSQTRRVRAKLGQVASDDFNAVAGLSQPTHRGAP